MGTFQHAVYAELQAASGAQNPLPSLCQRIIACAREYLARQDRQTHPEGTFDSAKRFSLSKRHSCCAEIRRPSRAYPYSEMAHGRSLQHVAHEFELEQHLTILRQTANRLRKHGLEGAEVFMSSVKVKRMLLKADLGV